MNGNKWSVSVWILLLVLAASPAISMSASRDSSPNPSTAQSRLTPEWHDYVAYLISHQLCESSNFADDACSSSIRSSASHSLYAFEESGWPGLSLLPTADSGSNGLVGVAQSRKESVYSRSMPSSDSHKLELGLHSLEDISSLTAKQVIPGSLLVTILALIGIVAVARRDIPGKDHTSASVAAEAKPGVVSVTYLRRGAN